MDRLSADPDPGAAAFDALARFVTSATFDMRPMTRKMDMSSAKSYSKTAPRHRAASADGLAEHRLQLPAT